MTRALSCLAVVLLVVGLVGGCAGYKIEENGTGCGYDVYAPEPYLLGTPTVVTTTTPPTLTYTFAIQWLPNYSKRYRVSSWAGLGKADFTFAFTDGWKLVSIEDKSDNTKIMESLTGLAKQLLPTDPWKSGDAGVAGKGALTEFTADPILYRIDFDADGRPACLKRVTCGSTSCEKTGSYPVSKVCR
jgi:hypothetical protein